MTDIVTKVSIWGQVVPIGWGSEGQEVVYLTQAEYDALPASKLTDGKIYKIKTSGVVPTPMPSSIDSFNRFITNQPLATYSDSDTLLESNIPTWANFFVVYSPNRWNNKTVEYPIIIPINFIKQSTTSDWAWIIWDDWHNTKVNSITYSNNTFTFSLWYGNAYLF